MFIINALNGEQPNMEQLRQG
jgi:hypothetical protein